MDSIANTGVNNSTGVSQGFETQPVPRTYTQDEVNSMVNARLKEQEQRTMRLQEQQPAYFAEKQARTFSNLDSSANQQTKPDDVKRMVAEEMKQMQAENLRLQNEARVQHLYNEFNNKKKLGAEKYADFNEKVNDDRFQNYPFAVKAALENVDNVEDVLYQLSGDPERLAQIEIATRTISEQAGVAILNKLSREIKDSKQKKDVQEDLTPATFGYMRELSSTPNVQKVVKDVNSTTTLDFKRMFKR